MQFSERAVCVQIGKMLVYQSGAVKMQLGDVLFDVLPGTEAAFRQDIAAVNAADEACVFLGGISQRVVACPDIVHLLRFMTHPLLIADVSSRCSQMSCCARQSSASPVFRFC